MQIDEKLYAEIKQYCELNDLKIKAFISDILRKAFNREKYGDGPFQIHRENTIITPTPEIKVEKKVVTYNIPIPTATDEEKIPINNKVENEVIKFEKIETPNKTKKRKLN